MSRIEVRQLLKQNKEYYLESKRQLEKLKISDKFHQKKMLSWDI